MSYETESIGIPDYIEAFRKAAEDNGEYAEALDLVNALDTYLKYADNYFGDDTALEQLTADKAAIDSIGDATAEGTLVGLELYSTSLILEGKTTVRHYFKVTDASASNTFTVNGTPVEGVYLDSDTLYVDICDIPAHSLGDVYTLKVSDSYTVSYRPVNYIKTVVNTQTEGKLLSLVTALYNYYCESVSYAIGQ